MLPAGARRVELNSASDRSEVHHYTYELRESKLVRVPNYFEIAWLAT